MRWIVGSSLRFRFLVVAAAAALVFFGGRELQDEKVDVFPEFAPTRVELQTACLGLSASEVEELVDRAPRGRPERRAGRRRDPLGVGPAAVPHHAALQARHELPQGPPARPGAPQHGRADASDLGGAAVHDAAGLRDEPDHEDRPVVEVHRPDGPVGDDLLEDPGAAASRPRRGQRRDLGRAAEGHGRQRPAEPVEGREGLARQGHGGHRRRRSTPACCSSRRGR